MSTSNDTANSNADDTVADDKIIEAEIVSEPNGTASNNSASSEGPGATTATVQAEVSDKKKGSKAGWILSALLVAFIGGLFAAPYAERSLVQFGLLPDTQPAPSNGGDAAESNDAIAALQTAIDTLRAEQTQLANSMSQQASIGSSVLDPDTTTRIAQLEDDIARIANMLTNTETWANSDNTAAVQARLQQLSDDVARLSGLAAADSPGIDAVNSSVAILRAEARQLRGDVTALREALAAMQAGSIESSPRGRLVLALGRIEDLALAGQDFSADLETLRIDASTLPVLDQQQIGAQLATLELHASGIVPLQTLMRSFPDMASAAKRASEKADGSFLANLFTVRRTDANAEGIDATLLVAEKRLLLGDVAGAVEALRALEGTAADAVQTWRQNGAAHVDVTKAFQGFRKTLARPDLSVAGGGA